jgi:rubrerythrin
MEVNVLIKLSELEEEIAEFYKNIRKFSPSNELDSVFQYLTEHSQGHAIKISKLTSGENKLPLFNDDLFYRIFEEIKRSLIKEIQNKNSLVENIEKLAKTEELIGKLYKNLALFYEMTASYYLKLCETIKKISDEEFEHAEKIRSEIKTIEI